ncbi:hypothetical protein [Acinetobacter sp. AKBS16]|uniref:hypothetical protein n=1 Tax=Acinetobacter sp. AKBS16 TaxID=2072504 RepID=UPI000CCE400E|nr:hypothetical protein [Acinetobacter sp. AKBS16]MDC4879563.1 hypothetical protein [Acinetobacter baumannii]MDC5384995.1 hypothetical protein [Acinetobacter baumannii]MDC5522520.1 hypothetical protein [Acinetobacter baumannii]MDC5637830.1 hypothetical protein [Acinetobacter baumannii]PNW17276.1 hypothetical protein C1642_10875 [Acinetobacter sp. AKBS16]
MDFYYSQTDGLTILKGIRNREDVRAAIGVEYRVLPKTEFSENSTDSFGRLIAQCWYDEANVLIEIELYDLDARLFLSDKNLLGISYFELKEILKSLDILYTLDDEGLGGNIFNDTVRFYIPNIDEEGDNAKVEAIWIKVPK